MMAVVTPLTALLVLLASSVTNAQSAPTITPPPASPSIPSSFPSGVASSELLLLQSMFEGYSTNASLSDFCVTSAFSDFLGQPFTTTTITNDVAVESTESGGSILFTTLPPETETFAPSPTFAAPCCSSCTLEANVVTLFYWPTPAPIGFNATTAVNEQGFTFTSPSIYLGINALTSSDLCGTGTPLISKTVSIPQGDLTSFIDGGINPTQTAQVNFQDFNGCPTNPFASTVSESVQFRCAPFLVVPTQIKTLDPAFADCTILPVGLLDPPSALTPVSRLVPSTSSPAPPLSTSTSIPPATTQSSSPASTPVSSLPASTLASFQASSGPASSSQPSNTPTDPNQSTTSAVGQPTDSQSSPSTPSSSPSTAESSVGNPAHDAPGPSTTAGSSAAGSPPPPPPPAASPSTVPVISVITNGASTFASIVGSSVIVGSASPLLVLSSPVSTVPIVVVISSDSSEITSTVSSSTFFTPVVNTLGASSASGAASASAAGSSNLTAPFGTSAGSINSSHAVGAWLGMMILLVTWNVL